MKKILAFFLSLFLSFSLTIPAYAVDSNSNIISDTEVKNYALHFMTTSQNNNSITINDFTHLYAPNNQLTGYYVTFTNNGTPAGYMLLSLISDENPIVEFAFEGSGPLSTNSVPKEVRSVTTSENIEQEPKILYTGAGQLYVPTQQNALYSIYDQEYLSTTNRSSGNEVNLYDGIINWEDANIDTSSQFKIKDFGTGKDYWLMSSLSSGNVCTPTAATNILWYWGTKRNCSSIMNKVSSYYTDSAKAKAIFNILFDGMNTDKESGTPDMHILDGYKTFFGEGPGSGTWSFTPLNHGFSYARYQTALRDNCPIHLILHTKNGIFDKGSGHCVMTLGFAQSNTGTQYLFVMDGWNDKGRFVKFNYYPYFFGYKISVTK